MLRVYILLVISNGHVDGLVNKGLKVCPAPTVTVLGNVIHSFLLHTAQLFNFLVQNLQKNTLSLLNIWWRYEDLKIEATRA